MLNPVIKRVIDTNHPAMPAVHRIYELQFPASERKPTKWLDEIVQRADYRLMIAKESEATIGFAIEFTPADSTQASLLEYLAIDSAYHGRGVGSLLVRALIGTRPILAEVEAGDELHASRRREFYRRLGFRRLIGLSYLLPLPDAPAMELMLLNGPTELSRDDLVCWISGIYASVYGCGLDDRRLKIMFSQLPSKI